VGVFLGDGDKNQIKQFANSRRHQVLIIGYEKVCPPFFHPALRT
jgi:DNA repair and recombination protein RAD54B